jgi:hypothetical protein
MRWFPAVDRELLRTSESVRYEANCARITTCPCSSFVTILLHRGDTPAGNDLFNRFTAMCWRSAGLISVF